MSIRFRLTIVAVAVIVVANSLLSLVALNYLGSVWLGEVQTRVERNLNAARAAYRGQTDVLAAFLEGAVRDRRLAAADARGAPESLAEDLRQMEIYSWPGNVRELRNIVERLAVLYDGSQIGLRHLPSEIRSARPSVTPAAVPETWEEFRNLNRQVVDELERRFLTAALNRSAQNVTQAAESVGIARPNFHALLRSHGLKPGPTDK